MAGYRSGTGRSAMLADSPVLGQSCRWRFDPAATAIGWSPDIGQEISPNGISDFLTGGTRPNVWTVLRAAAGEIPLVYSPPKMHHEINDSLVKFPAIRCKPGLRPWYVAARVRWVAGVRGGALGAPGARAGMTLRGSGRQPLPAKLSRADASHLPECAREVRWIREADLAGRIDHGAAGVGQQIGGNLESQVFDQV